MERYWPKYINWAQDEEPQDAMFGIRYNYGDLNDVVDLLARSPATRQAVLPVWFPEDTGAVHGERVPCSHFSITSLSETSSFTSSTPSDPATSSDTSEMTSISLVDWASGF
jgi:hypothetical protein